MSCTPLLYVSTDIDIPIQLDSSAQFTVADITDLEITLTKRDNSAITKTYKYSTSGISISGSEITLLIDKLDITTAGYYNVKMLMTDTLGEIRGITPCPNILRFYA